MKYLAEGNTDLSSYPVKKGGKSTTKLLVY